MERDVDEPKGRDLGRHVHRWRLLGQLRYTGGVTDSGVGLTQFFADGAGFTPRISSVSLDDRPPMNTLQPG